MKNASRGRRQAGQRTEAGTSAGAKAREKAERGFLEGLEPHGLVGRSVSQRGVRNEGN